MKNHPLGGYFKDGKIENDQIEMARFGYRAGRVFPQKYVDRKGSVTYTFAGEDPFLGEVLSMSSAYNRLTGTEHQKRYNMPNYPKAELVEIHGTGHNMTVENQEESFRVIRVFSQEN